MSLIVNYNSAAWDAHRNMEMTDRSLQTSIAHLSSGMRINTAADDPAGLVIATSLQAQGQGLGQAIKNSSDGINLVKTAEGALNEVTNLLQEMRTLAVHAANTGVNSTNDIAADQAQLDKAVASIDRIATTTKFNGKALLDGTYTSQVLQIGANSTDTISLTVGNQSTSTLGVNSLTLNGSASAAITAIDAAINTVSTTRATLGSFQKDTLQTTVNSLSIAQENLQASEANIRDADMAFEMAGFTRENILMQTGTAMLAQANQSPQAVLQLLK
jgi:flagellin